MDNRLRTSINHLTTGFLEEIIQLGGVGYTKESAENELKRRYEDVLKVANKYIGKCFIRVNCDSIHAYKFINHNEHSREICYEFIDIEYLQNFIACSHHDDCTVYVDDIEEMVEDSKEISEKEYNKYVEKYNKISEYVNMVVKTLSNN